MPICWLFDLAYSLINPHCCRPPTLPCQELLSSWLKVVIAEASLLYRVAKNILISGGENCHIRSAGQLGQLNLPTTFKEKVWFSLGTVETWHSNRPASRAVTYFNLSVHLPCLEEISSYRSSWTNRSRPMKSM